MLLAWRIARLIGRVLFWTFVVLAAAEISLRAVGWYLLRSRTRALEAEVPPGAYRMLFIGESTTYGLGVDPVESYPAQVAGLLELKHPSRRFLAFNRGVPSLTTASMLQTLPEKLELVAPDLVLLLVGVNDFHTQYNGVRVPGDGWLPRPVALLLGNLRVYRLVDVWWQLRKPKTGVSQGDWLDARSPRGTRLEQAEIFYDLGSGHYVLNSDDPADQKIAVQCEKKMEANLRRMIASCLEAHTKVVVLGYLRASQENDMLRAVAKEMGVPFVPTWPVEDKEYDRPKELFQADGFHPSAQGHRLMAERIVDGIEPLVGAR